MVKSAARPSLKGAIAARNGELPKCEHCGLTIQPIKMRDLAKRFCSRACSAAAGLKRKNSRARACAHCAETFIAKKSQVDAGTGNYCSHRCAYDAGAHVLLDPLTKARAIDRRRASIAVNGTKHRHGENSPYWKGGHEAFLIRHRVKRRETTRQYRKDNPLKVKEFSARRRGRKLGRLAQGTIARIGTAQRWKCAACRVSIKKAYHVDHIVALARGGRHEPLNIQLLCPPCNVRKSAKHPIDFMRERGFLL